MISNVLFLLDILYSIIILRQVSTPLAALKSHDWRWHTDAIHKWLPIHYSFVLVQISLPSLVVMC